MVMSGDKLSLGTGYTGRSFQSVLSSEDLVTSLFQFFESPKERSGISSTCSLALEMHHKYVKHLSFTNLELTLTDFKKIIQQYSALESLSFQGSDISDEVLMEICGNPQLTSKLTSLDIDNNPQLTSQSLVQIPSLTKLRTLKANFANIDEETEYVLRIFELENRHVDMVGCKWPMVLVFPERAPHPHLQGILNYLMIPMYKPRLSLPKIIQRWIDNFSEGMRKDYTSDLIIKPYQWNLKEVLNILTSDNIEHNLNQFPTE